MKKDILELTPQELNSFLIKKYGFGLHPFALILCQVLRFGNFTKGEGFPGNQDLLDFKKKFLNLKRKIIDTIIDYNKFMKKEDDLKWLYKNDRKKTENYIIKNFQLRQFFKFLDDEIKLFDKIIKLRTRGSPIKKRNLIVSLWGHLIQNECDKKINIEWNIIADLLDWFWGKLKYYNIYKELNPKNEVTDPEYLRNQFYRNKEKTLIIFKQIKKRFFDKDILNIDETVIFGKWLATYTTSSRLNEFVEDLINGDKKLIAGFESFLFGHIKHYNLPKFMILYAYLFHASGYSEINPIPPAKIMFPDLSCLC